MTSEDGYRTALAAARNQSGSAGAGSEENPGGGAESSPPWLIAFLAVGLYQLFIIPVAFLIAPLVPVANYLVVAGLWLWSKMHGLKPPTLTSGLKNPAVKKAVTVAAPEAKAALGAAELAEKTPGVGVGASLFFIVFTSGITPLIYLTALWKNNAGKL